MTFIFPFVPAKTEATLHIGYVVPPVFSLATPYAHVTREEVDELLQSYGFAVDLELRRQISWLRYVSRTLQHAYYNAHQPWRPMLTLIPQLRDEQFVDVIRALQATENAYTEWQTRALPKWLSYGRNEVTRLLEDFLPDHETAGLSARSAEIKHNLLARMEEVLADRLSTLDTSIQQHSELSQLPIPLCNTARKAKTVRFAYYSTRPSAWRPIIALLRVPSLTDDTTSALAAAAKRGEVTGRAGRGVVFSGTAGVDSEGAEGVSASNFSQAAAAAAQDSGSASGGRGGGSGDGEGGLTSVVKAASNTSPAGVSAAASVGAQSEFGGGGSGVGTAGSVFGGTDVRVCVTTPLNAHFCPLNFSHVGEAGMSSADRSRATSIPINSWLSVYGVATPPPRVIEHARRRCARAVAGARLTSSSDDAGSSTSASDSEGHHPIATASAGAAGGRSGAADAPTGATPSSPILSPLSPTVAGADSAATRASRTARKRVALAAQHLPPVGQPLVLGRPLLSAFRVGAMSQFKLEAAEASRTHVNRSMAKHFLTAVALHHLRRMSRSERLKYLWPGPHAEGGGSAMSPCYSQGASSAPWVPAGAPVLTIPVTNTSLLSPTLVGSQEKEIFRQHFDALVAFDATNGEAACQAVFEPFTFWWPAADFAELPPLGAEERPPRRAPVHRRRTQSWSAGVPPVGPLGCSCYLTVPRTVVRKRRARSDWIKPPHPPTSSHASPTTAGAADYPNAAGDGGGTVDGRDGLSSKPGPALASFAAAVARGELDSGVFASPSRSRRNTAAGDPKGGAVEAGMSSQLFLAPNRSRTGTQRGGPDGTTFRSRGPTIRATEAAQRAHSARAVRRVAFAVAADTAPRPPSTTAAQTSALMAATAAAQNANCPRGATGRGSSKPLATCVCDVRWIWPARPCPSCGLSGCPPPPRGAAGCFVAVDPVRAAPTLSVHSTVNAATACAVSGSGSSTVAAATAAAHASGSPKKGVDGWLLEPSSPAAVGVRNPPASSSSVFFVGPAAPWSPMGDTESIYPSLGAEFEGASGRGVQDSGPSSPLGTPTRPTSHLSRQAQSSILLDGAMVGLHQPGGMFRSPAESAGWGRVKDLRAGDGDALATNDLAARWAGLRTSFLKQLVPFNDPAVVGAQHDATLAAAQALARGTPSSALARASQALTGTVSRSIAEAASVFVPSASKLQSSAATASAGVDKRTAVLAGIATDSVALGLATDASARLRITDPIPFGAAGSELSDGPRVARWLRSSDVRICPVCGCERRAAPRRLARRTRPLRPTTPSDMSPRDGGGWGAMDSFRSVDGDLTAALEPAQARSEETRKPWKAALAKTKGILRLRAALSQSRARQAAQADGAPPIDNSHLQSTVSVADAAAAMRASSIPLRERAAPPRLSSLASRRVVHGYLSPDSDWISVRTPRGGLVRRQRVVQASTVPPRRALSCPPALDAGRVPFGVPAMANLSSSRPRGCVRAAVVVRFEINVFNFIVDDIASNRFKRAVSIDDSTAAKWASFQLRYGLHSAKSVVGDLRGRNRFGRGTFASFASDLVGSPSGSSYMDGALASLSPLRSSPSAGSTASASTQPWWHGTRGVTAKSYVMRLSVLDAMPPSLPVHSHVLRPPNDGVPLAAYGPVVGELAKLLEDIDAFVEDYEANVGSLILSQFNPTALVVRVLFVAHYFFGHEIAYNCKSGKDRTSIVDVELKLFAELAAQLGAVPRRRAGVGGAIKERGGRSRRPSLWGGSERSQSETRPVLGGAAASISSTSASVPPAKEDRRDFDPRVVALRKRLMSEVWWGQRADVHSRVGLWISNASIQASLVTN